MTKSIAYLFTLAMVAACSSDQNFGNDKTSTLTSSMWRTGATSRDGVIKFKANGTYEEKFPGANFKVAGVWEWINPNEISMRMTSVGFEGKIENVAPRPDDKMILKITNLTEAKLEGISHHFLDAEDSGFAKSVVYTAE